MSFVKAYYHIVINTKHRAANLRLDGCNLLYAYLRAIIEKRNSKTLAINGTSNHIHLLIELSATTSLSELMREIKQSSSRWLHNNPQVSKFDCWGKEYYATTISHKELGAVRRYIDSQRDHHHAFSFEQEMNRIVIAYGGSWEKWMEES